ncbi:hypothetical protein [Allorhodopirellula solitaria]|uniref:Squalene cyclase C-terminal domain-containing protein n=1 Tax=Allorhodopirellula solitaria TaxID=2527987 RepID=A0A5C5XAI8_9BACT|nr:hypothetical protein [Allorhodopirellula solitaria]TWT59195.1 hypothetical protein CA85_38910 [Allorhodopirellula solitaria]
MSAPPLRSLPLLRSLAMMWCSVGLLCVVAVADAPVVDGDAKPSREAIEAADRFDWQRSPTPPVVDGPSDEEILDSVIRGVEFLLADQNPNGSWGSATRTKSLNIYAPVPGAHHAFRTGTTSLAIAGLLETYRHLPEGDAQSDLKSRVRESLTRAEAWLVEDLPRLRRAGGDALYNVWGHGYSIEAMTQLYRWHEGSPEKQAQLTAMIQTQFEMLQRYESVDGGWGYYDFRYQADQPTSSSTSFVNGAVLVALASARDIGIEPPARMVERAIRALRRQRKPDFSYLYSENLRTQPMRSINRPGGSLGRSQCCNAALRLWGDDAITDNVIQVWLCRLYLRNGWLDIGRKRPIPHEAWMQVAGYFYYFGHYYAAVGMDLLPAGEIDPYQAMLAKLMLDRQEADGSWWDYPLYDYHQPYGTGFALLTLASCLE